MSNHTWALDAARWATKVRLPHPHLSLSLATALLTEHLPDLKRKCWVFCTFILGRKMNCPSKLTGGLFYVLLLVWRRYTPQAV